MFGRTTVLHRVLLAASVASTAACSKNAAPPPPPRIALLGDATGFSEGTFNARAAAGLAGCAAATGAVVTLATPSPDSDAEAQLNVLATENFDLVIAMGGAMSGALGVVARKFETSHFAIIDGYVPAPNVVSVAFKEQDGSFLAGALAALTSKTKRVAFLGGMDIPRLHAAEYGFEAGVRQVDPRVRVSFAFAGSFLDRSAASARAKALFARGSDVVYVVAGPAGLGAIAQVAARRNVYAIGVDSDQDGLAPGKVLTSVLRRVDRAAATLCAQTAAQKPASGVLEMGLAEGGVSLTDFAFSKGAARAGAIARVGRIAAAIVAHRIVPPATEAEAAAFRPVPVP